MTSTDHTDTESSDFSAQSSKIYSTGPDTSKPRLPGTLFLIFGVIFPTAVIGIELTTRMCALDLFDPMPTVWHVLLVSFVPAANLYVWRTVRRNSSVSFKWSAIANGIAIGISAYYTLLFLPLLPLAVIAVIWLIGFLPMAPLFSFVVALRGRAHLNRSAQQQGLRRAPGLLTGLGLFLAVLLLIDGGPAVTRIAMKSAAGPNPEKTLKALRILRTIGNENIMLRSCYIRSARMGDLISLASSFGEPLTTKEARRIYYRVYGRPFNSVPPPEELQGRRGFLSPFNFDPDQGGDAVSGRVRGLDLRSSRIDGSIDPDAAIAYLEWTMVFENRSPRQQEARARIHVPEGGVVSRLTLWIDGEPREAAFAVRSKVKQAYKKVTAKKRDPVLVTTSGPDRIMAQCFPVPPNGGTMKIRLGITAPMRVLDPSSAFCKLPVISERNFNIPENGSNLVWIESESPLRSSSETLKNESSKSDLFAVRGELPPSAPESPDVLISVKREGAVFKVFNRQGDPIAGSVVVQSLEQLLTVRPDRIVLVVDGSAGMQDSTAEISSALQSFPPDAEIQVIAASDEVRELLPHPLTADPETVDRLMSAIRKLTFQGGCDNVPALSRAWDIAAGAPRSAIVWIHGPQPVIMQSAEALLQKWERRPDGPHLYELEAVRGPNRIVEALDDIQAVSSVRCAGSVGSELTRILRRSAGDSIWKAVRVRHEDSSKVNLSDAVKGSDHLVRLWATERIEKLVSSGTKDDLKEAVRLAVQHKIVTRVTGAVVLESRQQYTEHGLTPSDPSEVPSIPEPETWALIILSLAAIIFFYAMRRRAWKTA
jgi:hypothetical protein